MQKKRLELKKKKIYLTYNFYLIIICLYKRIRLGRKKTEVLWEREREAISRKYREGSSNNNINNNNNNHKI